VSYGDILKLERAKRLELIRMILHHYVNQRTYEIITSPVAAGNTSQFLAGKKSHQLDVWTTQMDEIMKAWPAMNSKVQDGLMTIIRSQAPSTSQANRASLH